MFIDEVEVDDSTGALQSQASLSIKDPDTGEVIGAITLGFNLDALFIEVERHLGEWIEMSVEVQEIAHVDSHFTWRGSADRSDQTNLESF